MGSELVLPDRPELVIDSEMQIADPDDSPVGSELVDLEVEGELGKETVLPVDDKLLVTRLVRQRPCPREPDTTAGLLFVVGLS